MKNAVKKAITGVILASSLMIPVVSSASETLSKGLTTYSASSHAAWGHSTTSATVYARIQSEHGDSGVQGGWRGVTTSAVYGTVTRWNASYNSSVLSRW